MENDIYNDRWFILSKINLTGTNKYSYLTSLKQSAIKADILECNFVISSWFHWFNYAWRRRKEETITHLYAQFNIEVPMDEMFSYKRFKDTNKINETLRMKEIEEIINKDALIKMAIIEKYAKKLAQNILDDNFQKNGRIYRKERVCGRDEIKKYLKNEFPNIRILDGINIYECVFESY